MEQGTAEWFYARHGKATASRIVDILARTKSGYAASRTNYEAQLIAERLTGMVEDSYTSAAMQWGTDTEPLARAAYEFRFDVDVDEVGSIDHPTIAWSSASPDGLVGSDGLVEFKCPNTSTHLSTLIGKAIPKGHIIQMQWQMALTERQWCDWVSFDPRMPERMSLFVQRIDRDQGYIDELEKEVRRFLDEVAGKIVKLKTLYGE